MNPSFQTPFPTPPREPTLTSPAPSHPEALPHGLVTLVTGTLTGGLLLGLLGGRAIAQELIHLGLASEELFRGERLPTLPSPPP